MYVLYINNNVSNYLFMLTNPLDLQPQNKTRKSGHCAVRETKNLSNPPGIEPRFDSLIHSLGIISEVSLEHKSCPRYKQDT